MDNSIAQNSMTDYAPINPKSVIYIPNYNSKKPKIIKLADLAKYIPRGTGDNTTTNR